MHSYTTIEDRGSWGYDWYTQHPSFPHLHSSYDNYALANSNNYAIGKVEHRIVELYMYRGSEVRRHLSGKHPEHATHPPKLTNSGAQLFLFVHASSSRTRPT